MHALCYVAGIFLGYQYKQSNLNFGKHDVPAYSICNNASNLLGFIIYWRTSTHVVLLNIDNYASHVLLHRHHVSKIFLRYM